MDTNLATQLLEYFKTTCRIRMDNAGDLFDTQRNVLEFVMRFGMEMENGVFGSFSRDIPTGRAVSGLDAQSLRHGLRVGGTTCSEEVRGD